MLAMCTACKPSSSCDSRCPGLGATLGSRVLVKVFLRPGLCQGSGLAHCHITQVQQLGQDGNEAQLILLRDHMLGFFY